MNNINETLSISNEVLQKTNVIHEKIMNDSNKSELKNNYAGTYYTGEFNENIFGLDFTIQYRYYTILKNDRILHGQTLIKDKLLDLNVYNNFKSFDNILIHELLHIYQYVKNKIDYQGYNRELYEIVGIILNNEDENYSDIEKIFAGALYLTFPYEQDAMAHGLYKILDEFPSVMVKRILTCTEEYAYLNDLKYVIDNIDDFDEALFDNLLTKKKFLNMCKKSYDRYKTYKPKAILYDSFLIHFTKLH